MNNKLNYALSNTDIFNTLGNINMYKYKDLSKYKKIDDLFNYDNCFIILYEQKNNEGHWVTVLKRNNKTIELFDSFGNWDNDILKFSNMKFRKKNKMYYPYLTKLIYDSNYNVEYNDYKLQNDKYSTCGRWVICRILSNDMNINIDTFIKLFINKNHDPDYIVTLITDFIP